MIDRSALLTRFPADEKDHIQHILGLVGELGNYIDHFDSAVTLFKACTDNAMKGGRSTWPHVAARDGAITLYHFDQTITAIRGSFRHCPAFRSAVDHARIRDAHREFRQAFPEHESVRHSVAHSAELGRSIEDRARNATSSVTVGNMIFRTDGNSKIVVRNMVTADDTFGQTIGGKLVSYKVNAAAVAVLVAVRDKIASAVPEA